MYRAYTEVTEGLPMGCSPIRKGTRASMIPMVGDPRHVYLQLDPESTNHRFFYPDQKEYLLLNASREVCA
jgi:hypothetical protein